MIGATADSNVGGPEKTAKSLRDRFGCFEVIFGPNEWPIGSFERGDLKLCPSSVKPAQKNGEDQSIEKEKLPLQKELFWSLFCPKSAHSGSDLSTVRC